MAFSFGTPASTPAFSFSSAPAAASTPGFGAVSTPAFGAAASSGGLFGATATPAATSSAFGATTSTPSLFGAASTPSLFGAQLASTPASTPAFGGFGAGALVPATTTTSLFGGAAAAPAQLQASQSAAALVSKDNRPITHTTKWDDLSPQAQQYLLELEKRVVQFREECRQLDGDERLSRGKDAKGGIEEGARLLSQRITSLGTALRADSETSEAIQELVRRLLRNTETALHTFKRSYLWREGLKSTQGQALPSHVMEQLAGPVVLPSQYLHEAVAGFQENMQQYRACCAELEQVLLGQQAAAQEAGRLVSGGSPADLLQSLQAALTNLHDLLIHSAARLQAVDDRVAQAKEAQLASRRQAGDYSDPFAEAERQQQQEEGKGGGRANGLAAGGQRSGAAGGAGSAAAPAPAGQQPQQQQPAGAAGFGAASPFAASPSLAPQPSGLFGTLTPAASAPFGGTGGFGTPLFGSTTSTLRRSKGKK